MRKQTKRVFDRRINKRKRAVRASHEVGEILLPPENLRDAPKDEYIDKTGMLTALTLFAESGPKLDLIKNDETTAYGLAQMMPETARSDIPELINKLEQNKEKFENTDFDLETLKRKLNVVKRGAISNKRGYTKEAKKILGNDVVVNAFLARYHYWHTKEPIPKDPRQQMKYWNIHYYGEPFEGMSEEDQQDHREVWNRGVRAYKELKESV